MARIRTVKPEFWTDETLAECSPIARLLFVAALNFADDNGNLERSARQLKAQAFPYDSIDCEPLVLEMIGAGLIVEYQIADRKYLHIKGFLTHQKIDRPSKCRIPVYEESMKTRLTLVEPSSSPRPVRESKGVESKGVEGGESGETKKSRAPRSTATHLPADFELTPDRRAIAIRENLDPERTFAKFRNHFESASGANARKRNWDAAWQKWCMTEYDRGRPNGSGAAHKPTVKPKTIEEVEAEEDARVQH